MTPERTAELMGVVQRLPAGLQTMLGEGGGLVSGGEGQRVRLQREQPTDADQREPRDHRALACFS